MTSLGAFNSDELLTVWLTNGEAVGIRVTDASDAVCRIGSTTYTTLEAAFSAAPTGASTIELLQDVVLNSTLTLNNTNAKNKEITLTTASDYVGSGSVASISRADNFTSGTLLYLNESSATLTLQNIIVDGKNINTSVNGALIEVNNGSLKMEDGSVLQNGKANNGGAVYVSDDAALDMSSGSITGNTAGSGGADNLTGRAIINRYGHVLVGGGTTIRNFRSEGSAGAIYSLFDSSKGNVSSLSIGESNGAPVEFSNCKAPDFAGVVLCQDGADSGMINIVNTVFGDKDDANKASYALKQGGALIMIGKKTLLKTANSMGSEPLKPSRRRAARSTPTATAIKQSRSRASAISRSFSRTAPPPRTRAARSIRAAARQ